MLAKLHLDRTKKYEQALATYQITVMLIDFAQGRKHYMRIGAEQRDISTWDDIVIEKDKHQEILAALMTNASEIIIYKVNEKIRNEIYHH